MYVLYFILWGVSDEKLWNVLFIDDKFLCIKDYKFSKVGYKDCFVFFIRVGFDVIYKF